MSSAGLHQHSAQCSQCRGSKDRAQVLRRPQLLRLGICTSRSVISKYRLGAQGGVQQILPQLPKVHGEAALQLLLSAVQTASVRG